MKTKLRNKVVALPVAETQTLGRADVNPKRREKTWPCIVMAKVRN